MTHIDQLNRRLGDSLGYVGINPRFAWKKASECFYFMRTAPTSIKHTRFCWSDRIGNVWLIAQFRPPAMDEAAWAHTFNGEFPYPAQGQYYAHPETALPPGVEPTQEDTQAYIWSLTRQMDKSVAAHYREIDSEIQRDKARDYEQWVEKVQNMNPAFSNWDSGKRGGHVSFGGV
jgi:hypothetical protein